MVRRIRRWGGPGALAIALMFAMTGSAHTAGQNERSGNDPGPSPTLLAKAPSDAIVLFDGGRFQGWHQRDHSPSTWMVQEDGSVLVRQGDSISAETFGDFQLHIEFFCPLMAERTGQRRANSGVYLHGRYEVQVLDSYGQTPKSDLCGGVYSIAAAMVNASRPPDNWQTYDIVFRAPRFAESGEVVELPRLTVMHNGMVIHNNIELPKTTGGALGDAMVKEGPLMLQDHGDPVRYRNIWVRPL